MEHAIAQLRHLYKNLIEGGVKDSAAAKRIAEGLLSPAIEELERLRSGGVPGHTCFNGWFLAQPEGRQAVLRDDKWKLADAAFEAGRAQSAQALTPIEVCAVCGDGQARLIRFCDTCTSEYAGAAETRRAQSVAEPTRGNWIAAEDVDRLTRELDVALNGSGAASQAALCDVVAQAVDAARKAGHPLLAQPAVEPVAWLHTDRLGGVQAFTTEPQPGLKEKCQPLFTSPAPAPNALDAEIVKDAERYRWLAAKCRSTSEHWGGRWSIVVDGPAPATSNSEDDFDAAIDAAIAAQSAQGAKPCQTNGS